MSPIRFLRLPLVALALAMSCNLSAAEAEAPAIALDGAKHAPLVAVAQAGQRLVAVGDHGVIVLSDDGKTWRQARNVPVDGLLTALSFISEREGWAVGHGGVVLHTEDGGETWSRLPPLEDRPVLLSVWFENARHGMVVGAYGYAAQTQDGGKSWQRVEVGAEGDDHHLNHLFAGRDGSLFIAAEAGNAYRSADHGVTWQGARYRRQWLAVERCRAARRATVAGGHERPGAAWRALASPRQRQPRGDHCRRPTERRARCAGRQRRPGRAFRQQPGALHRRAAGRPPEPFVPGAARVWTPVAVRHARRHRSMSRGCGAR